MLQDTLSAQLLPQVSLRVAGVDLGDVDSFVCILDATTGEVLEESRIRTRPKEMSAYFMRQAGMRVALEAGTQSNWCAQLMRQAGHDVTVANPVQVRLIHGGSRKNDRLDAEKLARLLRYDRRLLAPVQHRTLDTQADLATLRSRAALVRARTLLVNHVRGVVKGFGSRIPKCETGAFARRAEAHMPPELSAALQPQLDLIEHLTREIDALELRVAALCRDKYPAATVLMQVHGVAEITALSFMLTIEDSQRFKASRSVAAYLGLTPGQRQSGGSDPPRRISKAGDREMRRLLVQAAHRILSKRGVDSDLKRHGQKIARVGTKEAKRRAVVAVARKLAVLLHALWLTGETYEPLRNSGRSKPPPT